MLINDLLMNVWAMSMVYPTNQQYTIGEINILSFSVSQPTTVILK